ncbi:MAG: protein kinase [bacterium]|nr:protein kinase [bacterium]
MPTSESHQLRELVLRGLLYLPVLLLFGFQFLEVEWSSGKGVGITIEPADDRLEIVTVQPEGPAEQGGLRAGDVVLAIEDRALESVLDYDKAADDFERGTAVRYRIRRGDQDLDLEIVPGMPIRWPPLLLNGLLILAFVSMGMLSLLKRPGSLPANLVYWLSVLLALEIALPINVIGAPTLGVVTYMAALLLNGVQFGTELHLSCIIPQRQRWLRRYPWAVPLFYGTGLALAALTLSTYLIEAVWNQRWLPWSFDFVQGPVLWVWMLLWAPLMIIFLLMATLRHPVRQGRRQAALVLLGALPWSVLTCYIVIRDMLGRNSPSWANDEVALLASLLPFPLSILIVLQMQSVIQNTLMMRLTSRLQSAGSVAKISQLISRDLNLAFHTKCNYVFFREESGSDLTSTHSSGARVGVDDIPESYRILKIVDREGKPFIFPDDFEDQLPVNETRWLERLRANVIMPVMGTDHRLIGLLILGKKASEEPYIAHDFAILRSLAGQIALAYENIGLQVQVHEQDRVQREVLDRFEGQEIYLVKECPVCGRCYDSSVELCVEDDTRLALTLPVERKIDDRYRLDQVLGKGGVAIVYRALDQRLNRTVAVKVLARSVMDAPDALRRFEREARIVAKMAHPRIVTIHDFGKTRQGCAYLVMEYIEGATLGQTLRRNGPYDPRRAAELFDQILDGLGAAHRLDVVHRDLKPDNVLIAENEGGGDDEDGEDRSDEKSVKLLDFGLAKLQAHATGGDPTNLTMPGFIIGTLAYMAPEQLNGDEADQRSDLFSIGVMAFETLTGQKPFRGRTPAQVLTSMLRTSTELTGDGPAVKKLNAILARCLAQDPKDRYQSVPELRKALIPAIRAYPAPKAAEEADPL